MSGFQKSFAKLAKGVNREEEDSKIIVKQYLVKWSNVQPDSDGLIRVKTVIECDVELIQSFRYTLPEGEYTFECTTDIRVENARLRRISRLQAELDELNNVNQIANVDGQDSNSQDDECEKACDEDYYDISSSYDSGDSIYYTSRTYFTRDGQDISNGYYEKEEVRRFSPRNLKILGITS